MKVMNTQRLNLPGYYSPLTAAWALELTFTLSFWWKYCRMVFFCGAPPAPRAVTHVFTLNGAEATQQGLFLASQSLNPHTVYSHP